MYSLGWAALEQGNATAGRDRALPTIPIQHDQLRRNTRALQSNPPKTLRSCAYALIFSGGNRAPALSYPAPGPGAKHTCTQVILILLKKLISLALRLASQTPSVWPDWVSSSTSSLTTLGGMPPEYVLDYLTIVAQEGARTDLSGVAKYDCFQSGGD